MNNLPNVFANKFNNKIDKNQEYTTIKEHREKHLTKNEIEKKINNIFKANQYIYKIKVEIETNKGIEEKTLVGKNNNSLITIDNELIDINSIKDINIK